GKIGAFLEGSLENESGGTTLADLLKNGKISTSVGKDKVDGSDCYVVNATTSDGELRLWISTAKAGALVKFVLNGKGDQSKGYRELNISFTASGFLDTQIGPL